MEFTEKEKAALEVFDFERGGKNCYYMKKSGELYIWVVKYGDGNFHCEVENMKKGHYITVSTHTEIKQAIFAAYTIAGL